MDDFKFPSIKNEFKGDKLEGKVYTFEKVDGSNVSFRKNQEGQVIPWSRGGPIGNRSKYYFDEFRKYLYSTGLISNLREMPDNLILFGEFTSQGDGHIVYYPRNQSKFFLIGAYDIIDEKFIDEEKRIFNEEIHYFDHPYFGAIVSIKKI